MKTYSCDLRNLIAVK